MDKLKIRTIVDILLVIFGLIVSITGIVKYFLPHGPHSWTVITYGLANAQWTNIHDYAGFIFVALIVIHFTLVYSTFKCMVINLFSKPKKTTKKKKK